MKRIQEIGGLHPLAPWSLLLCFLYCCGGFLKNHVCLNTPNPKCLNNPCAPLKQTNNKIKLNIKLCYYDCFYMSELKEILYTIQFYTVHLHGQYQSTNTNVFHQLFLSSWPKITMLQKKKKYIFFFNCNNCLCSSVSP